MVARHRVLSAGGDLLGLGRGGNDAKGSGEN